MLSLLTRRVSAGELTQDLGTRFQETFLFHVREEYTVIPVNKRTFIDARSIITTYKLRTLDALQLACARRARSVVGLIADLTFVSSDDRLLTAASADGFHVEDPRNYPDKP